jgi:predicted small secreted protein
MFCAGMRGARALLVINVGIMKKVKTTMKKRTLATSLILLGLIVAGLTLTGCNTWKGVGKDVERTGEAMQGKD